MNERLKELAVQAGLEEHPVHGDWTSLNLPDVRGADLERFAKLVRQDEREACAKLCDDWFAGTAAVDIRARSEK
jgi:hypothetical protein